MWLSETELSNKREFRDKRLSKNNNDVTPINCHPHFTHWVPCRGDIHTHSVLCRGNIHTHSVPCRGDIHTHTQVTFTHTGDIHTHRWHSHTHRWHSHTHTHTHTGDIRYNKSAHNVLSAVRPWEGRLFLVADKNTFTMVPWSERRDRQLVASLCSADT